jgi:hypothetical protein
MAYLSILIGLSKIKRICVSLSYWSAKEDNLSIARPFLEDTFSLACFLLFGLDSLPQLLEVGEDVFGVLLIGLACSCALKKMLITVPLNLKTLFGVLKVGPACLCALKTILVTDPLNLKEIFLFNHLGRPCLSYAFKTILSTVPLNLKEIFLLN